MMTRLNEKTENGSALVYILVAIALLAALTGSLMDSSSEQTQAQNASSLTSDVSSQSRFIRGVIDSCFLLYPDGDSTLLTGSGDTYAGEQMNHPYPIRPNHPYFAAHTDGRATNDNVEFIRCPGNPGDNVDHEDMFGGSSGKFLPPAPSLMSDWRYYAGADGVFYWIETDKSDPYIAEAFAKIDSVYSNCEADYLDASSALITMTSDNVYTNGSDTSESTLTCPSGSKCLRIWIRRNSSSVPACP